MVCSHSTLQEIPLRLGIVKRKDGDVNGFTKQPYTPQYKKILGMRKKLPVYAQMDEFFRMVSRPQFDCTSWLEGRSESASGMRLGRLFPLQG